MENALFAECHYVSPEPSPVLFARTFPSLYFYPRLVTILAKSGFQARKGLCTGEAWARSSEDVVRALESVGCRLTVEGLAHYRALSGPCVFAGNHMSTLETMVLPSMIQPWKDVTFVIKRSLYKYPIFADILTARQPICVGRVNPRDDLKTVLEEGTRRLEAGISVIVFPQGTRQQEFDSTKFNSIAVKLAKRAGVPVVPVALSSAAWSEGRMFSDFGPVLPHIPVQFRFGKPMDIAGAGKEEQVALCAFIRGALEEWGVAGSAASSLT